MASWASRKRLRFGRAADADRGQIGRIEAGQHGDRDQQRARSTLFGRRPRDRVARCGEHRRAAGGMHVDHPDAEPRRRRAGLRHGIRDVVKLEIEEHAKAAADELAHQAGFGDGEQLLADLDRAQRRVEPGGKAEGAQHVGKVERDDDAGISAFSRIMRAASRLAAPIHANPSGVSVRRGEYVSHLPQPGQRQ